MLLLNLYFFLLFAAPTMLRGKVETEGVKFENSFVL